MLRLRLWRQLGSLRQDRERSNRRPQLSYPLPLAATGERPPEDSGGPFGYADRVEALGNPNHEYHEEAVERLGDDHDPNAQPDIELIEPNMAYLAKTWPRKRRRTR